MSLSGYLAVLADSDLFGTLAIYCLIVIYLGFFKTTRETKAYRIMRFLGLLIVPTLHIIGTYFLNSAPA